MGIDFFTPFVILFSLTLLCGGGIIFWCFRLADISAVKKIVALLTYVCVAIYLPYQTLQMLGSPITVSFNDLPDNFRIAAYVAHDHDKLVDVLVSDEYGRTRLLRFPITSDLQTALADIDFCKESTGRHFKRIKKIPGSSGRGALSNSFSDFVEDKDYILPPKDESPT
jgi:hypothetical protein